MSEYQYVSFRAVDRPVSEKNLAYMHKQSSRAEITPWSFENEYHYGDFRGDPLEMLRRGYDIHLHYANFGVRKLLIRLPFGLPDAAAFKPYKVTDSLCFQKDKQGPGGTLQIQPYYESGELDELFDVDQLIGRLVPIRAEILDGDLRPLYLAHLAVCCDDDHDPPKTYEAPVPAGLDRLSDAQRALAELFEVRGALIAAAARESPRMPAQADVDAEFAKWLTRQSQSVKDAWLRDRGRERIWAFASKCLRSSDRNAAVRHGRLFPVQGLSLNWRKSPRTSRDAAQQRTAAAAAKKRREACPTWRPNRKPRCARPKSSPKTAAPTPIVRSPNYWPTCAKRWLIAGSQASRTSKLKNCNRRTPQSTRWSPHCASKDFCRSESAADNSYGLTVTSINC